MQFNAMKPLPFVSKKRLIEMENEEAEIYQNQDPYFMADNLSHRSQSDEDDYQNPNYIPTSDSVRAEKSLRPPESDVSASDITIQRSNISNLTQPIQN